jgi:hypothetical protein
MMSGAPVMSPLVDPPSCLDGTVSHTGGHHPGRPLNAFEARTWTALTDQLLAMDRTDDEYGQGGIAACP